MKKRTSMVTTIHLILEVLVVLGLLGGLLPFVYYLTMFFVIPFSFINLILSIVKDRSVLVYDLVIFLMAIISIIPILGFFTRLLALAFAIIILIKLTKK